MSSGRERWEALYDALLDVLSSLGTNHPDGEGDFWIVDDDWGGNLHKVCITEPDFWSNSVKDVIQKLLATSFSDWGVMVVFSDGSDPIHAAVAAAVAAGETNEALLRALEDYLAREQRDSRLGFIVYADRIEMEQR